MARPPLPTGAGSPQTNRSEATARTRFSAASSRRTAQPPDGDLLPSPVGCAAPARARGIPRGVRCRPGGSRRKPRCVVLRHFGDFADASGSSAPSRTAEERHYAPAAGCASTSYMPRGARLPFCTFVHRKPSPADSLTARSRRVSSWWPAHARPSSLKLGTIFASASLTDNVLQQPDHGPLLGGALRRAQLLHSSVHGI